MRKKSKILVVEDKALIAEDLVDRLESFGYTEVLGPFDNAEDAIAKSLLEQPDIAVLDIHLKGKKNGITLNRELQQIGDIPVIFLTQLEDDETLQKSISSQPIAFLNKPFTNASLKHALLMAEKALPESTTTHHAFPEVETVDDRIFIRNGRGKVQILVDDILWIQSGGGETSAITLSSRHKEGLLPYTVGLNLNKLEYRLSFNPSLVRCSRFHIVNIKKIERIVNDISKSKNKKILEIAGTQIAVGDKYRKDVIDKLHII